MYNAHPYFSLKNLGKESVHSTQQNTVNCFENGFHKCDQEFKTSITHTTITFGFIFWHS